MHSDHAHCAGRLHSLPRRAWCLRSSVYWRDRAQLSGSLFYSGVTAQLPTSRGYWVSSPVNLSVVFMVSSVADGAERGVPGSGHCRGRVDVNCSFCPAAVQPWGDVVRKVQRRDGACAT